MTHSSSEEELATKKFRAMISEHKNKMGKKKGDDVSYGQISVDALNRAKKD
jgi:hypothetical protein